MCVLGRTEGQAEEEVEEDVALSFHLHHLLHTFHLLASLRGVYSHTGDLLSLFFLPEPGFLVARKEAFVGRMGAVEVVWGLSAQVLVGGLSEADVACLRL